MAAGNHPRGSGRRLVPGFGDAGPTLWSERLCLRPYRPADHAAATALWGDPAVTRFIGGRALGSEEVWGRLLRHNGHWVWQHYGYWAVEERAGGAFVGEVGFASFRRDLEVAEGALVAAPPEAGWALLPAKQGRGYATEALRRALDWADSGPVGPESFCMIDPANAASLKVAAKCGFTFWQQARYRGAPVPLFRRAADGAAATALEDPGE